MNPFVIFYGFFLLVLIILIVIMFKIEDKDDGDYNR
jgi:hypothetical protein